MQQQKVQGCEFRGEEELVKGAKSLLLLGNSCVKELGIYWLMKGADEPV